MTIKAGMTTNTPNTPYPSARRKRASWVLPFLCLTTKRIIHSGPLEMRGLYSAQHAGFYRPLDRGDHVFPFPGVLTRTDEDARAGQPVGLDRADDLHGRPAGPH